MLMNQEEFFIKLTLKQIKQQEMSSHRKLQHKNSIRYHSEDTLGLQTRAKNREGAQSIQENYRRQSTHQKTTDLFLNEEDLPALDLKTLGTISNQLTLPKIKPKSTARNQHRLFTQKFLFRKQLPLFSLKYPNLPLATSTHQNLPQENNYVFATHQGTRIKNQDRISIQNIQVKQKVYQYFAVFDGHGGHLTSTFLNNQFHILLQEALQQGETPSMALKVSLKNAEEKLKKNPRLSHKSGSCAVICLISGEEGWIANVGDSRAISINTNSEVNQISRDHKPQDQIERKRIEYNGGEVYRNHNILQEQVQNKKPPFRVYPGKLSVSRTIGDIRTKKENPQIIISEPDVYSIKTKNLSHILLFSDGIYQTLSNTQISSYFLSLKPSKAINELFDEATRRNSQDNRSLIAITMSQ